MKKRNIVHSALSLSLTAALCLSMAACGGTQTPADSAAASQPAAPSAAVQPSSAEQASAALPVKALNPKQVEENPYMAKSDANIHHDGYNTDSTDEILPLAIYPEINVSYETTNANASPAIYFDSYGHAVVPLLGGIAIRDLNAEETKTLGYFSPKQHDGGGYVIQSSYTFLDASNRIVCPTSNNHVLMLRDVYKRQEMNRYLNAHQQDFMQEDTQAGMIYAYLEDYTGDRVCSKQLDEEALGNVNSPADGETRAICEIMNTGMAGGIIQGWVAYKSPKRYKKYGSQKGWERVNQDPPEGDG